MIFFVILPQSYSKSDGKQNIFPIFFQSRPCPFTASHDVTIRQPTMTTLNLPPFDAKIRQTDGRAQIFDILRRKYVALTPEEWVRQHFVNFLVDHKGYPKGLLANELELRIGEKRLRCDTVLYNKVLQPRMIIEYKAPTVTVTQKTFDQIAVYNLLLHVDYLVVSNGLHHYCCRMDYDNKKYLFLTDIPDYENI